MELYRTMMFEGRISQVIMAAGYITQYLAQGIAFLNGFAADVYCDNVLQAANLHNSLSNEARPRTPSKRVFTSKERGFST